ncbi:FecR family protein [Sinomicrobium soli]|uniref:FecR family protein n=1 Tax=Sinomicrobium sp. N-1-3-6 TaxID=2219864 RepID=UPI000DCC0E2D|nr:FecR domain-containing protein [Sinomicrobium sp. N-1-3-6]RAV27612.1 hypothetical protein DN748_17645 [Sinomicrobium sp. N-1-3-6]
MENIIIKYLNNTISNEELDSLEQWLREDKKNEAYFKEFVRQDYTTELWSGGKPGPEQLHTILKKTRRSGYRFRPGRWLPYAAVLVIALGIWYTLYTGTVENRLDYTPDPVTLRLSDGTLKELRTERSDNIRDPRGKIVINQRNNRINYSKEKRHETPGLAYNELTVPKGRRFSVLLSDSTEVFLNSGSTLKFPVSFDRQESREVYLEGEGFFAVAKDPDLPFRVYASGVTVQVLGTRFNVRAYQEDRLVKTSLQEGAVQVSSASSPEPVTIAPGEAASYDSESHNIRVTDIDIENDVAWTENRLVFIDEPFSEVIKKIERSYGVRIANENRELNDVRFYGDFNIATESVEDVLKAFTIIKFFEYTLKDDLVTIKK